jgi:hypothetical protein
MPPTNDTGYEIIVGPDVNGDHFSVAPDEDYDLPEPPRGVETVAPVEDTPSEPADGDLSPVVTPKNAGPTPGDTQNPPGDTPPAGNDTEGAQE